MTCEGTDQTALDTIAVRGCSVVDVAFGCIRPLLRCAEQEAQASWLGILGALRVCLG